MLPIFYYFFFLISPIVLFYLFYFILCYFIIYQKKIPIIHDVKSLESVPNGSLVRYQGMIQDVLDPEIYSPAVQVTNQQTNQKSYLAVRYSEEVNEQVCFRCFISLL
jgi:hypothetical protein